MPAVTVSLYQVQRSPEGTDQPHLDGMPSERCPSGGSRKCQMYAREDLAAVAMSLSVECRCSLSLLHWLPSMHASTI